MSENTSEGFVIEGELNVAVKGHLALYSIVGGRIGYAAYAQRAQELELSERYVPRPRKAKDAFARAKDVLHNMSVPTLDTLEGWDGVVQRKIVVKPLKKGNEYAVSIEHSGRSRGRRHKSMQNLFRISFQPPEGVNPDEVIDQFRQSCWNDEVEAPDLTTLRRCVTTSTYWEDQVIDDPMLLARLQTAVLDEFINTISSIDSTMLRNDVRSTLMSLGGLPFKSGAGAWFIPSYTEENEHLTTLENYANLLTYFGNHNALSGSKSQETWLDSTGAPRKWYRQKSNLRVMGYIDNARQLEYIKDDIQNSLSLEVAEYQEKLLNVAKDFNGTKVKAFDAKLDALTTERQDLKDRLQNLSSLVGGVEISFDPFSDISSEFEGRLGVIGEENSVTTRLRGLMSLSD
tara:strand:+ start:701 stop:1903 length:1203 start_codon:yes stop_codon:yes gene_type:complete